MGRRKMLLLRQDKRFSPLLQRVTLAALLPLLMGSVVAAEHVFSRFGDDPRSTGTVVSLVDFDPGGVSLKTTVSGLRSERISIDGREFGNLQIAGEGITAQVGKPRLPVVRRLVEIPFGATVSVELGPAHIEELSLPDLSLGERIAPLQPPVPKIPGAQERIPFVIDEEHYRTDAFWPPELVRVREIGVLRQTRVALVEIFPVRYNPRKGLVKLCSQVQFQLSFQGVDLARTRAHKKRYTDSFSARPNSRLFIATDPQPSPLDGWSTPRVGYLVVVDDDLYEAVLPLTDWKRQQGFQVSLVRTSQAGYDKAEIKSYIKDAYDTWDVPPTFLLLVGDVGQIPTYSVGGITTDLYYTTMDEENYFPDIQVGRISATDSVQLAMMVKKIVEYEKGLWDVPDGWTRKGYFMATNDSWNHGLAEGTQEYSMHLARAYGMICDSLYAYYGTGTPIAEALDDGRCLAVYTGHGSFYGWAGPSFTKSDVQALQNGQMYPLICSHACNTGGYHKGECFGETWLRAEEKGAVSFWGSTVSSYWDEDDILQKRMFDALFDSSLTWLSGMMDKAKLELWIFYGGEGLSESYYKMYNILGDPSMHLWTRPPKSLVASHADHLRLGISSFVIDVWQPRAPGPGSQDVIQSTTLVPVNDALASISMKGELCGTALTTPGGKVSVKLEPPPLAEDSLEIAVSKTGYRPYLGFAEIRAFGPYLLYQDHVLDDSAEGNGDGQASADETFQLEVIIENVGSEVARQVTAVLAVDDPYVQISCYSASFGNIPAKDSCASLIPYECHIHELCPSGHQIDFTLTAMDSLGGWWNSEFQIQVVAPEVLCYECCIQDDPPGGNGNGVAESGETLEIVVTLRNEGLGGAAGVTAMLTSIDPHIQVLSDSSSFGDLTPGSQASGSPAYQITVSGAGTDLLFCSLVLNIAAVSGYANCDTFALMVGAPGFSDDMEAGVGSWTHRVVSANYMDHWHISGEKSHGGGHSWKCGDDGNGTYSHYENGALVSPAILLASSSTLTFWHWMEAEVYDARRAWDGGVVEISTDEGAHWKQIAPVDGYLHTIYETAPSVGSPFEAGMPCFSGSWDWKQEQFDLSAYSGLVHIRFRFGSDQYTEKEGWYIDDLQVAGPGASFRFVWDLQLLCSHQQILLLWPFSARNAGRVHYEVYRALQPAEVIKAENLVAVVSEPRYVDDLRGLSKSGESLFYAVVAVDEAGRRSPSSPVVGRWVHSLELPSGKR